MDRARLLLLKGARFEDCKTPPFANLCESLPYPDPIGPFVEDMSAPEENNYVTRMASLLLSNAADPDEFYDL